MKKKHLGQHFLHNKHVIERIANSSSAQPGDIVVEVGPGDGALTGPLLLQGFRVIAIEYDRDLIVQLTHTFQQYIDSGMFTLICGDILETHYDDLSIGAESYHVVANIPYYITGAIIQYFLGLQNQPLSMSLVMQRQVADRIVAREGKHSLLSLSVHLYGNPKKIMNIASGAFTPPPEVESALLVITGISRSRLPSDFDGGKFFDILHRGFGQKRKQLITMLKGTIEETSFDQWVQQYSLPRTVRAEDVPLEAWIDLVSKVVL